MILSLKISYDVKNSSFELFYSLLFTVVFSPLFVGKDGTHTAAALHWFCIIFFAAVGRSVSFCLILLLQLGLFQFYFT